MSDIVKGALNAGKLSPSSSDTFASLGTAATSVTDRTFKLGLADHLTEHAAGLLALAQRLKKDVTMPIEAEFQGLELSMQALAAHVVKFKKVLIP